VHPLETLELLFHLLGRVLEWKQLNDAMELRDTVVQLDEEFRGGAQFLAQLRNLYRKVEASGQNPTSGEQDRLAARAMRQVLVETARRRHESVRAPQDHHEWDLEIGGMLARPLPRGVDLRVQTRRAGAVHQGIVPVLLDDGRIARNRGGVAGDGTGGGGEAARLT
jgi:hypothetical protein